MEKLAPCLSQSEDVAQSPSRFSSFFNWKSIVFAAAILFCLTYPASPALALACGVILALIVGNPYPRRSARVAKWLLQVCVVMLGFSMDLQTVLRAGAEGAVFATLSIGATLWLGYVIGRQLRISNQTSTLISSGTAICGGSAIAAVSSVLAVGEGEVTVALSTVFILNAAALCIFPSMGNALHLTQEQFGTWAGIAIHDISSVVGAASVYGVDALQTATAVKLFRSLWIAPLTLGIALAQGRRSAAVGLQATLPTETSKARVRVRPHIQIPWFIGLFLLASFTRSLIPEVAAVAPKIESMAKTGLTLTLFLVGAGLSWQTVRAVGWKALIQGVLLWLFISVASLLVILWL